MYSNMISLKLLIVFLASHLVYSYDEIETQLQRIWKHSDTKLTTENKCLLKSIAFSNEKEEDNFINGYLGELRKNPGWGAGTTNPRLKATALLTKAALALPTGDLLETGLNFGGTATILVRMMLEFDGCERKFWGFDSFAGLPDAVKEDGVWGVPGKKGDMAVAQDVFEGNLKKWNAWNDTRVIITKGYFSETLPKSPVQHIAFLRLDGDVYTSTMDALENLYHKVVPGGYIYIDDYGSFEGCREAVDQFRTKHHIYEPLRFIREENMILYIQFEAVWWKKRM